MPRRKKRKRVALEDEPLTDYGTTRDGETDNDTTRDDGGPQNPTGGGEDSRTGNTTRTADSSDSNRATDYGAGGSSGSADGVNSAGGHPPTPLTRDDIPALVREISRQLRPDNAEVHTPLVPGTRCCVSRVPLLGASKGPVIDDTPGLGVHWSCG